MFSSPGPMIIPPSQPPCPTPQYFPAQRIICDEISHQHSVRAHMHTSETVQVTAMPASACGSSTAVPGSPHTVAYPKVVTLHLVARISASVWLLMDIPGQLTVQHFVGNESARRDRIRYVTDAASHHLCRAAGDIKDKDCKEYSELADAHLSVDDAHGRGCD